MKIGKILLKIITVAVACVLLMSIVLADAKNISDLKDVRQDKWYFEAIEYVFDNGFMAGTSQSAFSPDSGVTRAMVVQTFYAIAGKPESSAENKFSDVKSNSWYSSSVNWANANGLAAGYPNGTFRPDVKVTREQLAVFFKAFSGYQKKNNINRAPIYDYTDYDNVGYTVYDETHGREVTEMVLQYPKLVLIDQQLDEGTQLRITANSLTDKFAPVTTTCKVDTANQAIATIGITERGRLHATFSMTDNEQVMGILYDAKGQLVGWSPYDNTELTVNNLTDGQ